MGVQKKNMLEAFRNAGEASTQPAGSAGPFASGAAGASGASRASSKPASTAPRTSTSSRSADLSAESLRAVGVPAVPAWLPWVAGVAFAFVLGIALGRASVQTTVAAGSEPEEASPRTAAPSAAESRPLVPANQTIQGRAPSEASTGGAGTSALFDKANRYTVVAATYGTSRDDFAWATHDQLRDAGLPVFPPIERGRNIVVVVGAAPTSSDLSSALERLKGLTGWDGGRDAYADAYVEQIDRLLDR